MDFKDQKTLVESKSDDEDDRRRVSSPMTRKGVYAAISYMTCAVLLIMFNKAALSSYKFPCANVITLFQMICSSVLLYGLRCRKIISFKVNNENQSTNNFPGIFVPWKTLLTTLPLAVSYLLYMLVSMESVRGVSVPMYTTLRRTTVAFTMIVEYVLVRQKYSIYIVGRSDMYSNLVTMDMGCNASIMCYGFLFEPRGFLEHNSKLSSHTNNLRELKGPFYDRPWLDPLRWSPIRSGILPPFSPFIL
ncbi:hypothetical protein R6Q57_009811 [Mikania cordata]